MSFFKILNIGFSNIVMVERVISIINADSASGRRLRSEAKTNELLVDATNGRKTRSVIITDSKHLILSSLRVESLSRRIEKQDNSIKAEEEAEE
jgi:extracellular matrix regulatory protein A